MPNPPRPLLVSATGFSTKHLNQRKCAKFLLTFTLKCISQNILRSEGNEAVKPDIFVSGMNDSRLTVHGLKHWVARLVRASDIKFHLHRFRHTFATNLGMKDVGLIKVQKLIGHTDLKMIQTYVRSISTEEMKDDINKLSFESLY